MGHILSHSDIYQKPAELRNMLARIFGEGLLVVEGNQHKQQRKIMVRASASRPCALGADVGWC